MPLTTDEAGLCCPHSPLPLNCFCELTHIAISNADLCWSAPTRPVSCTKVNILSLVSCLPAHDSRNSVFIIQGPFIWTIQTRSFAFLFLAFSVPVGDSTILRNTENLEVQFSMCCLQMTNVFCWCLGQNAFSKIPLSVNTSSYKTLASVTGWRILWTEGKLHFSLPDYSEVHSSVAAFCNPLCNAGPGSFLFLPPFTQLLQPELDLLTAFSAASVT